MVCRDCPRCTEAALFSILFLPFRVLWALATFWNIGLLRRKCPQCHHQMRIHQKFAGRFAD